MNQDNPYAMNQTCKVCGEPAAGFHFGAFTCEGCKSFFGRSYNNITSIADCKNNGECIINKKNRTACKACRLRKCLVVGMSKSGSRYGRRSNWFKIHCLMQEQHQHAAAAMAAAAAAQQQHNAAAHHHHHHHLTRHQHQQQSPVAHLHAGHAAAGHQQQQQQQAQAAAAAAAVHHQHQSFVAAAAAAHVQGLAAAAAAAAASGQKQPGNPAAVAQTAASATATPLPPSAPPGSAAARASDPALSMLYHTRSKEELLMLGLDEYGGDKVPRISPSVGSPDSNHSDSSSVEVSVTRGSSASNNSILTPRARTDSGAGSPSVAMAAANAAAGAALSLPQPLPLGRKELTGASAFLPLHFPGLAGMPVMPPPPFLPPSHLLLPGYHPSLYPHHGHAHPHHGLLKPSSEHQQQAVAAAAAVQHLFNSAARFTPAAPGSASEEGHAEDRPASTELAKGDPSASAAAGASATPTHANPLMNGSNAAEELTKRFYLDALLKSQRYCGGVAPLPPGSGSPPPAATKLPALPKYDHSISALVTPNSESGRERLRSRQSTEGYEEDEPDCREPSNSQGRDSQETKSDGVSDCDEDLVVSMTPPRSPPIATKRHSASDLLGGQDNPIDLSMKTTGSSSVSSALSSAGSAVGGDDDPLPVAGGSNESRDAEPAEEDDEDEEALHSRVGACNNNNNNNSCHENKNNDEAVYDTDEKMETLHRDAGDFAASPTVVDKPKVICCDSSEKNDIDAFPQIEAVDIGVLPAVKRVKLQTDDSLPPLDLSKI